MKYFVAVHLTFYLPFLLTHAIPFSKPDATVTQQYEERAEQGASAGRRLYVDDIASNLESKEKRDPAPAVNSSALNSPFASTHHMGHGPVVRPLPSTTSTSATTASSTSETFPNVVDTHSENKNHTYQPLIPTPYQLPSNITHLTQTMGNRTFECNSNITAANITTILLTADPEDNPNCKLVTDEPSNVTATNTTTGIPSQNKYNPAYLSGGEAGAPPGYHSAAPSSTSTSSTLENTTMIEVQVGAGINGTEGTTTVQVTHPVPADDARVANSVAKDSAMNTSVGSVASKESSSSGSSGVSSTMSTSTVSSSQSAATPIPSKGRTPYALPPGFTGP